MGRLSHWIILFWTAIAIGLRLYQLEAKPLWTDEVSTLAFSLGHGFTGVPLNQVLTADGLLQPLRVTTDTGPGDAAQAILAYSNHPPLFFAVMHLWLQATHHAGDYVSIGVARSLSAIVGGLLTPLIYGLVRLLCGTRRPAYLAAAIAALCPFGIYLAQEARHYTLALVWITASLYGLVAALQRMQQGKPLPIGLVVGWTLANILGIATHYFTALALAAQVLVLVAMGVVWRQRYRHGGLGRLVGQLVLVGLGTAASAIPWLLALLAAPNQDSLTQWIQSAWRWQDWLNPITHSVAGAVSMAYLLPVQGVPGAIAAGGAITAVVVAIWSLGGWSERLGPPPRPTAERATVARAVLWGVTLASLLILLLASYLGQVGLAQTLRYHFIYLPAFVGMVAVGLAQRWRSPYGRVLVVLALVVSAAGAFSVTHNLAYQKVHRPDIVVTEIAAKSDLGRPLLLATSHQSHGQTGRLMAIAWGLRTQHPELLQQSRFYLDPQPCPRSGEQNCGVAGTGVREAIASLQPGDVWLFNYEGRSRPAPRCRYQDTKRVDGYKALHYRC